MTAVEPLYRSRSQKAAAVLASLGTEDAAKVMSHMSEAEIEQLTFELATLGQVDSGEMQAILHELQAEALAHRYLVAGGEQQAREILRRLRGVEADEIVDRLLAAVRAEPFYYLRLHEPAEVAQQLRSEQPQTVALVLSHLPTRHAAMILGQLDPEAQAEVARRIATLDRTSPDVLQQVEQALMERFGEVQERSEGDRGGVSELAALLNQSDRTTERAILGHLQIVDPELAEQVRALMFVFEDITTLPDRAIQEVLRQIEAPRLALAIKGVSPEVRATVERNLSERGRESLVEEYELLGPVPARDVEAAQSEIVRTIRELEQEGTIVLDRGEGDLVE